MAESRSSVAMSLPEVRPGIRKLAEAPAAELLPLWRELGPERRREILVYFFSTASSDMKKRAVEILCERGLVHGFRVKSLLAKKPDDLAAFIERVRVVEPVVHIVLVHCVLWGKHRLGWLFLHGLAKPDTQPDGENIVPLGDGAFLFDHRELDNAVYRLFALASAEEAIITLLFYYKRLPELRPGLKTLLKRVLETPIDELSRRGRELLDEWDPRERLDNIDTSDVTDDKDEGREWTEAEPEQLGSAADRLYADFTTPGEFRRELDELRRKLKELAADMEAAAKAARESGTIPSRASRTASLQRRPMSE